MMFACVEDIVILLHGACCTNTEMRARARAHTIHTFGVGNWRLPPPVEAIDTAVRRVLRRLLTVPLIAVTLSDVDLVRRTVGKAI